MLIDEGLDTGPILLARSTPIGADETTPELEARLAAWAPTCCSRPSAASRRARSSRCRRTPPERRSRRCCRRRTAASTGRRRQPSSPGACAGSCPGRGRSRLGEGRLLKVLRAAKRPAPPPAGGGGHGRGRLGARRRGRLRRRHRAAAHRGPAGEPARHGGVGLCRGRAPARPARGWAERGRRPRGSSPSRSSADSSRAGRRSPTRLAARDVEALDDRERAFLHELVLGTLRRRGGWTTCSRAVEPADRPARRRGPTPCAWAPTSSCDLRVPRTPPSPSRSTSHERPRRARRAS